MFFTDGDRALSFIEAGLSASTKRDRVQRAIRSLLGLAVVEQAQKHVRDAAAEVNRRARAIVANADLKAVTTQIDTAEDEIQQLEAVVKDATSQFEELDEKLNDIDKRIGAALQKGDHEKLNGELESCKKATKRLDEQLFQLDKQHSNLFKSPSLARDLIRPLLEQGVSIMDGLREEGKIPNTTLPVLEDRLSIKICICGESLDQTSADGSKRRRHIEHLIDKSRKEDEIQKLLTEFYYRSKSFVHDQSRDGQSWIEEYEAYLTQRDHITSQRDREGQRMRSLEAQIDALGSTDIAELRRTKQTYQQLRDQNLSKKNTNETRLGSHRELLVNLKRQRDKMLQEEKKGVQIASELNAVQDITSVLQRAYERIGEEELRKVSDKMNSLFLDMIGADPEQNSIIKRAEISDDYDIVVYGVSERRLNPDQDLNGASRRALTMAFILALTKVSEIEAANVIDTPLGMMAGYVKRSVLRTAVAQSSQIVMFLTSAEIKDCEDNRGQICVPRAVRS